MAMMKFSKKIVLRHFLCLGLVLVLIFLFTIVSAKEVAVIKVQYRKAEELVPVVQSMLSAGGTVTVSKRVNSLVVGDTAEAIRRVQAYLEQFDKPVQQVRIHVRFNSSGSQEKSALAVRGRYSNDNVSVGAGRKKKDGVDLSTQDHGYRKSSISSAFVVAMSGSPAFIRTGKEIPYRQGSAFFRRHAPGGEAVTWQSAESGFEVTPTVVGDNVHLKIVPRIAYDHCEDAVVRFFGARTELTIPFGQWVEIGGTTDQQNEIVREILCWNQSSRQSTSTISIMVERP